ncbi:hypothetical protein L917_10200 [Phytophthora nicotianae]|uniref:Uncharacterized protein n=1 Tax=Phytophthora nicotianae TaxID=4792 RepID=W2L1B9_PHYNI|nr:hypothetical protein L917_10200 [Phytophthora nicotianae]
MATDTGDLSMERFERSNVDPRCKLCYMIGGWMSWTENYITVRLDDAVLYLSGSAGWDLGLDHDIPAFRYV